MKLKTYYFGLFLLLVMLTIVSCQNNHNKLSPKPRAYPRIDFPQHSYEAWDTSFCKFTMQIPTYSKVVKKDKYFNESIDADCWFDLVFDDFKGSLHCSYFPITSPQEYDRLKDDAFKLVDKHNAKASFIDRFPIQKKDGSVGFLFHIEGPVASSYQFYVTDSINHFFRGSLYFNNKVNVDSMKPVIEFLAEDVNHILASLEWKS